MKRFLLPLVLLIATAITSIAQNDAATDSLSYYLGHTQGAMLARRVNSMGAFADKFRAGMLRAVRDVMSADTTDLGYYEGLEIAMRMQRDITSINRLGAVIDRKEFLKHFEDGLNGINSDNALIAAENQAAMRLLQPYQDKVEAMQKAEQERRTHAYDSISEANARNGKLFMDSLRLADKSVKFSEDGLGYKLLVKGKGKTPGPNDKVKVHYTGRLIDGTVFDKSPEAGAEFTRDGVIKGFGEGLGMMNCGSKYIFYIPSQLAYGPRGASELIGPNATLIFEVELLEIL